MIVRKFFFIFFCFMFLNTATGQFGVRGYYNINSANEWETFMNRETQQDFNLMESSYSLLLDYWLRLPQVRIEFYPYLSLHQASSSHTLQSAGAPAGTDLDLDLRQISAGVLSHIYIFDFFGDCECPTFSKQGGFFSKGFFLLAGVGGHYSQKAVNKNYGDGSLNLSAIIGTGLDIGINDLITITPIMQYSYYPGITWNDFGGPFDLPGNNVSTSLGQFQFGLRLGLRADYEPSF